MKVGIFGGTGFVGASVAAAVTRIRGEVTLLKAPRVECTARDDVTISRSLERLHDSRRELVDELAGFDVVVNAAGLAQPTAVASDALYGANALLPGTLALAASAAGVSRFVHVSSAAVLGYADLTESWSTSPETPYGASKALGEFAAHRSVGGVTELAILRPTSVHGIGRQITETLAAFARSPFASVARPGDAPSPQVLVENVGAAVAHLAASDTVPEFPVLQPYEGLTVSSVLERLGNGRRPLRIPTSLSRVTVQTSARLPGAWAAAQARRLEMLWFGQRQTGDWLVRDGYQPRVGLEAWNELGRTMAVRSQGGSGA